MEDNLNEVFTQCWGGLFYGSVIASNAFHTGVIGTKSDGTVNMRTVVLRSVDPDSKQIFFYTDIRSAKMSDIKSSAAVSWLFYDAAEKVQVRLGGEAIVHYQDDVTQNHWGKVHGEGQKSYMAEPGPSSGVDHPTDGLEHLNENEIEAVSGYTNFAVIATQINYIEWLSLKKDGHRRAEFRLLVENWKGQWLIP